MRFLVIFILLLLCLGAAGNKGNFEHGYMYKLSESNPENYITTTPNVTANKYPQVVKLDCKGFTSLTRLNALNTTTASIHASYITIDNTNIEAKIKEIDEKIKGNNALNILTLISLCMLCAIAGFFLAGILAISKKSEDK